MLVLQRHSAGLSSAATAGLGAVPCTPYRHCEQRTVVYSNSWRWQHRTGLLQRLAAAPAPEPGAGTQPGGPTPEGAAPEGSAPARAAPASGTNGTGHTAHEDTAGIAPHGQFRTGVTQPAHGSHDAATQTARSSVQPLSSTDAVGGNGTGGSGEDQSWLHGRSSFRAILKWVLRWRQGQAGRGRQAGAHRSSWSLISTRGNYAELLSIHSWALRKGCAYKLVDYVANESKLLGREQHWTGWPEFRTMRSWARRVHGCKPSVRLASTYCKTALRARRQTYIGEMLFVVIGALMSVGLAQVGRGACMAAAPLCRRGAVARMWPGGATFRPGQPLTRRTRKRSSNPMTCVGYAGGR